MAALLKSAGSNSLAERVQAADADGGEGGGRGTMRRGPMVTPLPAAGNHCLRCCRHRLRRWWRRVHCIIHTIPALLATCRAPDSLNPAGLHSRNVGLSAAGRLTGTDPCAGPFSIQMESCRAKRCCRCADIHYRGGPVSFCAFRSSFHPGCACAVRVLGVCCPLPWCRQRQHLCQQKHCAPRCLHASCRHGAAPSGWHGGCWQPWRRWWCSSQPTRA